MANSSGKLKGGLFSYLRNDIPAGLVVFLVAIPLCMGIALASNAPIMSGLISGIIGGLVIPLVSRSELSVSGPAAGLIAVVIMGIEKLGSFEGFLMATVLAGVIQVILGFVKAGTIAYFFPGSVIKGMLSGIGLIIIFKQIPHALGVDKENFASDRFVDASGATTFDHLITAFQNIELGALIIGLFSILLLIIWKRTPLEKINWLPAGLIVVTMGILLNYIFHSFVPDLALEREHLVDLGGITGPSSAFAELSFPDWSVLSNYNTYVIAGTIAIIASLESLLCVEAVDRMDPYQRKSPMNLELKAQGIGNTLTGLIGGLPITSVIVRSGTNVTAGGRTRMAAIVHGLFLLVFVLFLANVLSLIPLASLAGILIMVGFNLAKPQLFAQMYRLGYNHFIPFAVTALAILFTDLLTGIALGMVIGVFYVLKRNYQTPYTKKQVKHENKDVHLHLSENVSFMNKASIRRLLQDLKPGEKLVVDATRSVFVDYDIIEMLHDFQHNTSPSMDIGFEIHGLDLDEEYKNPKKSSAT